MNTGGDCYHANGRYFMDNYNSDSNAILVHGEVSGQGNLKDITFGHCWIEDGDICIDKSNGRNITLPKMIYRSIGNVDWINNYHEYSYSEFLHKITSTKHWGPWDLKTKSGY